MLSFKLVPMTTYACNGNLVQLIYIKSLVNQFAWMSLVGTGCRLQTCRDLTVQWFKSTFRATCPEQKFMLIKRA